MFEQSPLPVLVPPDFWPVLLDEADRRKMQAPEALIALAIEGMEHRRLCK